MSGRRMLEELREEEALEERSAEQIFADTQAEIEFMEQNFQLPGAVEPLPQPAPGPPSQPVEPVAPPPVAPQTPAQEMGPTQPEPNLLQDLLFQEQNQQLPGAVGPNDPLLSFLNRSDHAQSLMGDIEEHQTSMQELEPALDTAIPLEQLSDMSLSDLDEFYQTSGIEPTGPLAGLNREIVTISDEINAVVERLDAMDPETFTTQAEVDEFRELYNRYESLISQAEGLQREYQQHAEDLYGRYQDHYSALFGPDGQGGGLADRYNTLLGPGGIADTMMTFGEGGLRRETNPILAKDIMTPEELDTLGVDPNRIIEDNAQGLNFPFLPGSVRQALRDDLGVADALKVANMGPSEEQRQQIEAMMDSHRRQRQNLTLGATSEAFSHFRDDPGFQEFANQLTTIDVQLPQLDPRGRPTGETQALQIAARQNPYGGAPVPLSTDLLMALRGQPEESFGRSLGGAFAIPFQFAGQALGSAGAGRLGDVPGMGEVGEILGTGLEYWNQGIDWTTRAVRANMEAIGEGGFMPLNRFGSPEGSQAAREIMDRPEDPYEGLPWYSSAGLFVAGELVLDPFNLLIPGASKGARAAAIGARARRGVKFTDAVDNALRHGTAADTDFLLAVRQLSSSPRTVPDNWRLLATRNRFREAALKSKQLNVSKESADIFGQRVSARLWARDPAEWSDILNQELDRLATAFGRPLDEATVANFNRQLRETDAFRNLRGSEFWRELGVDMPKAMVDSPAWRQGRQKVLTDPDAWWDITQETPLDQLVAVEFGPDIAIGERWNEFINWRSTSTSIPGSRLVYTSDNVLSFVLPGETRPTEIMKSAAARRTTGGREISDAMMENLENIAKWEKKKISKPPRTMGEYWDEVYRLTNEYEGKKFPGGSTPDTVLSHPMYQRLTEGSVGRLRRGEHVPRAELPIAPYQLADLTKRSIMYGRNLFDELLNPNAPVEAGMPASRERYAWINDNLPATESQLAEVRKLSGKLGKSMSDRALKKLRWDDARDLVAQLEYEIKMASYERRRKGGRGRKTKPKEPDFKELASYYEEDIFKSYVAGKEIQAANEFRGILADLLLPDPTGRYRFTRGARVPDGATANGWLRMSEREIIELFRTAPDNIKNLPHIGPFVNRIGMIAQEMSGAISGPQVGRQRYPWLMEEAKDAIESLVDDLVEVAPLHETKHFHDWLVDQYQGSALTRPGRPLRPSDINLDSPRWVDLDRSFSELNAARAHYAAIGEQVDRLKAALALAEHNGKKLAWRDLLDGSERQAVQRVIDFFKDPESPMTLAGFRQIARQSQFMNATEPLDIEQIVRRARELHSSSVRLGQDMAEWQRTANSLIRELGAGEEVNFTAGASLSNTQRIRQFAQEYQFNYPEAIATTPDLPETRRLWREDSTTEIASTIAKRSHKPAWQQPRTTIDVARIEGAPREIPGPKWASLSGMDDAIQNAFATFANDRLNSLSPDEVVQRLAPDHMTFEDWTSRALLVLSRNRNELAKALGVSVSEARRLREELTVYIRAQGVVAERNLLSFKRLTADGRKMTEAAELVSEIIEAHARLTGMQVGQVSDDLTKPILTGGRVRRGVVEMPEWFGKVLADWIDEQTRLRLVQAGPGVITKVTAEATRKFAEERVGPVLDYLVFGVTPGETLNRLAAQLGPDAARFVRPRHQRPVMDTFDPLTATLDSVDWVRHGWAFDRAMRGLYDVDEIWGRQARQFTPTSLGELTKMSKGIKMGDYTAYVGHTVWRNVIEEARASGRNVTDVYDGIMAGMDEIVQGGPGAQMLYGAMFENSEELGLWLRWARQHRPDLGKTNWDLVKDYWGDLTPHMSLARMPEPLHKKIFGTTRFGNARHGKSPVADNIQALDDFVHDKLDLSDLTPDERLEAEFWQGVLRENWDTKIKPELRQSAEHGYFSMVHVDDLDALLFPDEAFDPFDGQMFAERMGTVAANIEHARLGYKPENVAWMLKLTYFVKRTLGRVWLRYAPRYVINNIAGNMASLILSAARSDTASPSLRVVRRVANSIDNKSGSALGHRMMTHGIAGTEMGDLWLRPKPGVTAKERAERVATTRKTLLEGANMRTGGGPARKLVRPVGQFFKAVDTKTAQITDFLELDARRRVWTAEFDHRYKLAWGEHLNGITSLSPELRETLAGQLELSDISRILNDNEIDETTRFLVFRGHNDAINRANLDAYIRTRDALRDYQVRNRYDTLMDRIFPYHFWTTKNLLFVTRTALDRPVLAYNAMKTYDAWSEQWDDLPPSAFQKIRPFTVPEQVPFLGGRTIAIRPHNVTNPAFFYLPIVVDELRDAWEANEDIPLVERAFRTTMGGGMSMWREVGYSPGPHLDLVAAGAGSEKLDSALQEVSPEVADYWQSVFNSAVEPFIRPSGFRGQILPIGGLESGLLWAAGDQTVPGTPLNKEQTIRQLYANMTKNVYGTPWNHADVNALGRRHVFEMFVEGELGPVTERVNAHGEVVYDYEQDVMDVVLNLAVMVANGDIEALENDEYGKKLLDRFYAEQGKRRVANYATALSFGEITEVAMLAHQGLQQWEQNKLKEDFLPAFGNIPIPSSVDAEDIARINRNRPPDERIDRREIGGSAKKRLLLQGFNARIEQAANDREEYIKIHNYSPEARAEAAQQYEETLSQIYKDAEKAGLYVPVIEEGRPRYFASEHAFGTWNPATQRYEGARMPWLTIIFTAWNDPESLQEAIEYHQRRKEYNNQEVSFIQASRQRRDRRGVTGEFYNRLEDNEQQLQDEIARIRSLPGVSENVKMKLEDQAQQKFERRRSRIYGEAEQKGVSLAGNDTEPPFNTPRWYDAAAATNGDMRLLYEQAGLSTPDNEGLLTFDQILKLDQREDRFAAHTHWAMDRVVEAMGLDPYIPGTNKPNPRFMTDGHFDEELWKRYIQARADEIVTFYNEVVSSHRGGPPGITHDPSERRPQLLAQEITFKDFFNYVTDDVLPKQTAYEVAYNAAVDEVRKIKDQDERQAAKEKYREVFGPHFMRWEETGGSLAIDMDEVATKINDLYVGLNGEARRAFEIEHGSILTGDAEFRTVDPEKLTAVEAQEIARQYGIEIPTYTKQYELTAGRKAIEDLWHNELSSDQKAEWRETFKSDDYEGFIVTRTGQDPETGDTYSYETINVDALSAEQVAEIRNMFDIPLPADPVNEMLAPDLTSRLQSRPEQTMTPRHQELLKEAEFDKQTEEMETKFYSGEIFLESQEDIDNWQAFYQFRREHEDLYDKAQEVREATGVTWKELAERLEERPAGPGEGMTLKEFAQAYVQLIEDYDMPRLWNARADWLKTEHGQSLLVRSDNNLEKYMSDELDDAQTGDSGGSGGGSGGGRGGGGFRPRGGFRSSAGRSMTDFDSDVRAIFRLDQNMLDGRVSDAEQRFEIASRVAELLEARLQVLQFLPREIRSMFAQLYVRSIERTLGETPTLEGWLEVLRRYGGGSRTETGPTLGLQEQPEFEGEAQVEQEELVT